MYSISYGLDLHVSTKTHILNSYCSSVAHFMSHSHSSHVVVLYESMALDIHLLTNCTCCHPHQRSMSPPLQLLGPSQAKKIKSLGLILRLWALPTKNCSLELSGHFRGPTKPIWFFGVPFFGHAHIPTAPVVFQKPAISFSWSKSNTVLGAGMHQGFILLMVRSNLLHQLIWLYISYV